MPAFTLYDGPGDEAAAGAVRRELRGLQEALGVGSPALEDLQLAATELVTNAVRAGAHRLQVRLDAPPPHLRLDVTDDAPGAPALRATGLLEPGGRGLHIVAALCEEWGTTVTAAGKTVWARLAR